MKESINFSPEKVRSKEMNQSKDEVDNSYDHTLRPGSA